MTSVRGTVVGAGCSRRTFLSMLIASAPTQATRHQSLSDRPNRARYTVRTFPAKDHAEIDGVRHRVLTASPDSGPGRDVIVLHEITGASERFFGYTDTLVDAGFTVHCPVLFGPSFVGDSLLQRAVLYLKACGGFSDFECWSRSAYRPLNPWLVALAEDISGRDRRRLGAIGMCLTGIQPLAMLRCRSVVAPVLCQPTLPVSKDERSRRDLGLPPSDFDFAHARIHAEQLKVLLIRYRDDRISSAQRARRLVDLLSPQLKFVELDGDKHSSLVHDPDQDGRARREVVAFLDANL
jgi:dienelactone hydrolase